MTDGPLMTPDTGVTAYEKIAVATCMDRAYTVPAAIQALKAVSSANIVEELQWMIVQVARIVKDTEFEMSGLTDIDWDAVLNHLDDAHDLLDAVQPHRYKSSPQSDRLSQVLRDIERGAA